MPQYNQAEAVKQQLAAMEAARQKAIAASQLPKAMNGGFLMPGSNQVLPNLPGLVPELSKDPVAQKRRQSNLDTLYKQSPMYKQERERQNAGSQYNQAMNQLGKRPAGQAVLGMGPQGVPEGWRNKFLVNTGSGHQWMSSDELEDWGKGLVDEDNPQGKSVQQLMNERSEADKPFSILSLRQNQISNLLRNRQSLQDLLSAPNQEYTEGWKSKVDWGQQSVPFAPISPGDSQYPGYRWNPSPRDPRI